MFSPDLAFGSGSVALGELELCHVRLQDDARFPWLILIPRRSGAVELEDLGFADRRQLGEEIILAGRVIRQYAASCDRSIDKLNVGALGNITRQLHVHVIGRRTDDPAWPGPVWGTPAGMRLADRDAQLVILRNLLGI